MSSSSDLLLAAAASSPSAMMVVLLGTVLVVAVIVGLRWHPFVALLLAGWVVAVVKPPAPGLESELVEPAMERLASAFGETCEKIGLLLAFASIIGASLTASGAARRLVLSLMSWFGERRVPLALVVAGFVLGIPVYFDTVFLLLIPIVHSLWQQTRRDYLLVLLSIIVGGTMAHSLVPPTPGPLLVASRLEVGLGPTLVGGLVVGGFCAFVGYSFARWLNRFWPLEPAESESSQAPADPIQAASESIKSETELPPLWLSAAPIALPLLMLILGVSAKEFLAEESWLRRWCSAARLDDKNVVMGVGALCALVLLQFRIPTSQARMKIVQAALSEGGMVLLITASGGAFGGMIQQTGVGSEIAEQLPATGQGWVLLTVAFALTGLVRVAQGSATVAMITAVGILAPVVQQTPLEFHPVYLVLAIGCGSKLFPWMNDSGFWLVGRIGGLSVGQTLRTFSLTLTVMGVAGWLLTLLLAWVFPAV